MNFEITAQARHFTSLGRHSDTKQSARYKYNFFIWVTKCVKSCTVNHFGM